MSPDPSSFSDTDLDQQAAAWLARHDRGLTAREQDEFFQWLADDPRHGECLARHQRTVAGLKLLAQWQPEHGSRPNPDLLAPPKEPPPARRRPSIVFRLWLPLAAAASLAVVLWWQLRPAVEAPTVAYAETPPIVRKVLEDGSTVDLNRGAEVEITYTAERRDIRLVRGEANFAVAKNLARPFIVNAGGVEVRAVGTAFNVNLRTQVVEVLVTEGRVAVGSQLPTSNAQHPALNPQQPLDRQVSLPGDGQDKHWVGSSQQQRGFRSQVFLDAGERTVVDLAAPMEPKIESVPPEEMTRVLAWQPRQLEFNDTPLAQVVAEFNAGNRVKMVVDDAQLASVPVGASLRSDNVEGFIRLLEASFHVKAERRSDGVIVLRPE